MQYGMPTFVVPLSVFPEGYLNRGDEPLPFISLGATKRQVALYHMGLMGNEAVRSWFQEAYQEQVSTKLNMGKSCLRFTNPKRIPYELIGELVTKITLEECNSINTTKRKRRIIRRNHMLLGSHVSMSGKKMLLGSAEEAASYGSTTFMIYTGAPQNTRRKPIEEMNIEAGQAFMKEHNLK